MPPQPTEDPFIEKFFSRIPRAAAESFSPEQLSAIKMAFAARSWGTHAIDLRLSLPLPGARYYLVFLLGRERRPRERRLAERLRHPFARLGNAAVAAMFVALLLVPLLLAIYTVKSALGIKLIPGGGGHATMRELFEQLGHLFQ
jgi:hypothetical protein